MSRFRIYHWLSYILTGVLINLPPIIDHILIPLLLWFSQMSLRIISFHVLHTCLHLWRLSRLSIPTIIMMSLNIRSGNMSQAITF